MLVWISKKSHKFCLEWFRSSAATSLYINRHIIRHTCGCGLGFDNIWAQPVRHGFGNRDCGMWCNVFFSKIWISEMVCGVFYGCTQALHLRNEATQFCAVKREKKHSNCLTPSPMALTCLNF